MMEAVQTRLETRVPDLAGRLGRASDFARLMRANAAPTAGVSAYLIPAGLTGQPAGSGAVTGLFRQGIRRALTIVLLLQSTDRTGERALDRADELMDEIVAALCGWAPAGITGVFELAQARPVETAHRGVLAFLITVHIPDQLRITP